MITHPPIQHITNSTTWHFWKAGTDDASTLLGKPYKYSSISTPQFHPNTTHNEQ